MAAIDPGDLVLFLAGMVSVLAASRTLSWAHSSIKEKLKSQKDRIQDGINLNALGKLTRSENVALQQSAARMLMDRAMQDNNLSEIVDMCSSEDKLDRLKAATTLGLLAKTDENKDKLVQQGALGALAQCVVVETDLPLQRVAIMGVFDLVYNNDDNKEQLLGLGMVGPLLQILETSKSKDLLYWALVLVHQLALKNEARDEIIQHGGLRILVHTTRSSQGHAHMQKLCCHSLVQLCSTHNNSKKGLEHLQEIVDEGIVPLAVVCLKSEDVELVWWALGLIHELALKDVGKDEIRKAHGLVKALLQVLGSSESNALIYVLRTLGFLAIRNDEFKMEILQSAILDHVLNNLSSTNPDIVYWAVVLMHDLAMCGDKAAIKMLKLEGLVPSLVVVVKKNINKKGEMSLTHLVAETFGFLCSSEQCHLRLMKMGIMKAIHLFVKSDDPELLFWSAALLLNLTVTSDEVKALITKEGGVDMLLDLIMTTKREQVPSMAAKTLVMLGLNSDQVNERVRREVLDYLAKNVMAVSPIFPVNRVEDLNLIGVFARGDAHKMTIVNTEGLVECLASMVWHLAHRTPGLARLEPNFIYHHGVAAVRCLVVLSSNEYCQMRLLQKGAVSALAALVLSLNLKDDNKQVIKMDSQPPSRKLSLAGDYSFENAVEPPRLDSVAERVGTRRPHRDSITGQLEVENKLLDEAVSLLGDEEGKDTGAEWVHGLLELKQQAVIALANCAMGCLDPRERALYSVSGALHALWAAALRPSIPAIPFYIESCLTFMAKPPPKTIRPASSPVMGGSLRKGQAPTTTINTSTRMPSSPRNTSPSPTIKHPPPPPPQQPLSPADRKNSVDPSHQPPPSTHPPPSMGVISEAPHISPDQLPPPPTVQISTSTANDGNMAPLPSLSLNAPDLLQGASPLPSPQMQIGGADSVSSPLPSPQPKTTTTSNSTSTQSQPLSPSIPFSIQSPSGIPTVAMPTTSATNGSGRNVISPGSPQPDRPVTLPSWMTAMSSWVELNATDKTPGLVLSPDNLTVRNDNWTFESIRGTVYVGALGSDAEVGGRVGYEVTLMTSGIMQMGWASPHCRFEPEKGVGVGDDKHSYAFDGSRCRAWHGDLRHQQMCVYGKEWREGDIVTVLMDVEAATISFRLNGQDLGIAFRDVDTKKRWYPALSLATGQHCSFNFGSTPFIHSLPATYIPLTKIKSPRPLAPPMKSSAVVETLEYRTMFDSKLAAQRLNRNAPSPTLYFEAKICKDRPGPLEIGIQAGESVTFLIKFMETGHFEFAKQTIVHRDPHGRDKVMMEHALPEMSFASVRYAPGMTVGCGVSRPDGKTCFTINGLCVGAPFSADVASCRPYIVGSRVQVNYGQRPFVYEMANREDAHDRMAAGLALKALTYITPRFMEERESAVEAPHAAAIQEVYQELVSAKEAINPRGA
eukprot:comp23721_c0_seq1/m.40852 comp23721_c0_seq1/g.40852  ORF comp23721_c0_seq1/g.40852 comp23721_c0_seq1/m.40852 type:complete len:1427 (-) comp23721_c0_seq1:80-4360(-)